MWKPMLAAKVESDLDFLKIRYPVMASPKLDGIRAMVQDGGVLVSRNLKPIRNKHVQQLFGRSELDGLDGELICGDPSAKDAFRVTSSAVMSEHGTPSVRFWVFDYYAPRTLYLGGADKQPFHKRLEMAGKFQRKDLIVQVNHRLIDGLPELQAYEIEALENGFEGIMLRNPDGPYKLGRSSLKEGWLLKIKRWNDSEAEILELVEQMHNGNEASREITGRLKRSSHQANMVPKGTLGSLRVRDLKTGVEFNIGSGLDDAQRSLMWSSQEKFVGQIVKYKYFPTGSKDRPRFPIYLGIRDKADISE